VYTVQKCVCSVYTLQVHISTTCSIVILFTGRGSQSPTLQEVLYLNWKFLFDFHNFDLCDVFQESNFDVKWDLPVLYQNLDHKLSLSHFKRSNKNLSFIMKSSNNYDRHILIFHFGFERSCFVILYQILTLEKLTHLNVYVYHILV
jgi:hypothetical protein